MKRISSRFSRLHKLVFPIAWLTMVAGFVVVLLATDVYEQEPLVLLAPVIMTVVFFVLWKLLLSDLIARVDDARRNAAR